MIDATKSPVPAWKRQVTIALLAVLIVVAGFIIYTKDLKGSSGSAAPPAAAANAPATTPAHAAPARTTSPTTNPPGPAISSRNPFG